MFRFMDEPIESGQARAPTLIERVARYMAVFAVAALVFLVIYFGIHMLE